MTTQNDKNQTSNTIEADVTEAEVVDNKPKEKSRFKFHLTWLIILGLSTWAFITYAPQAEGFRTTWNNFIHPAATAPGQHTQSSTPMAAPKIQPATQPTVDKIVDESEQEVVSATPIFEPTPELETVESAVQDNYAQTNADVAALFEQLQQQLITLQNNMSVIYEHQTELSKQQIQAQLYLLLEQASSPARNLMEEAAVWKSISLLPLLDDTKREQAHQASADLHGLNNDIQMINQNINSALQAMAEKLHPVALAEIAATVDGLTDVYADASNNPASSLSVFSAWLDWLKEQFKISKVKSNAVVLTADPFADIKTLIQQLDQLKVGLTNGSWDALPDIDNMVHELDKYGVDTIISTEAIQNMQEIQQKLKTQATAWMEQI